MSTIKGKGTKEDPWQLKTPPGTSEYIMYKDDGIRNKLGLGAPH